jgi:ribonuclease G
VSNELLISSTPKGERIALLQDKRLVEYHYEEIGNNFLVGDIFLGTVKKVSPGLNAAFVDIGHEKDAFLHYLDLGPQVRSLQKFAGQLHTQKNASYKLSGFKNEPDIDKLGKIDEVLTKNQNILVQVVKEPISTKGPRLSCEISLAGRFLVLVPFSNTISISKKIVDRAERNKLVNLVKGLKPDNFGVIIRTVAAGKETSELEKDLLSLIKKWEDGMKNLKNCKPGDKVIGEMGRATALLRDILNESFDSVTVDSQEIFDEVHSYISSVEPEKTGLIKLYNGKTRLFEQAGVEKQLKLLFGKSVSLPSGGYLIIEQTEAMVVIDVNSGSTSNKIERESQESTALTVNLEAVKEIARQLRLRDIGGIICIDFIDQKKAENRKLIYEKMKEELKNERAKHTVLPLSKFGVMQITRQRVRPGIQVITNEVCPSCGGTGTITASLSAAERIENNIDFILGKQNEKGIKLQLHPYLYAFYTKGLISKQVQWWWKYKTWVTLVPDSSLGILDFTITDKNGEVIELM